MNIFSYTSFHAFLRDWLASKKRGETAKLSKFLKVSSSLISQVISQKRLLSTEQAYDLAKYFHFNKDEKSYWLNLYFYERAGSKASRDYFKDKARSERKSYLEISKRFKSEKNRKVLAGVERSTFYSSWKYQAIRQLTSVKAVNTEEDLSRILSMPANKVRKISDFLLKNGLITKKRGVLSYGQTQTHIHSNDPIVKLHHSNWRAKALDECLENEEGKFFTAPMSIPQKSYDLIEEKVIKLIEEVRDIASYENSENDCCACLNIDFFQL